MYYYLAQKRADVGLRKQARARNHLLYRFLDGCDERADLLDILVLAGDIGGVLELVSPVDLEIVARIAHVRVNIEDRLEQYRACEFVLHEVVVLRRPVARTLDFAASLGLEKLCEKVVPAR